MTDWSSLATESRNPASERIDELTTTEMLALINREDARIATAVGRALRDISTAVDLVAAALARGDRLLYIGAGTSGRLGILDATECPPTYGTDPESIQGLIAGGPEAVFRAVEGAEDDADGARRHLEERALTPGDIVAGIAASGVTPYVLGGLEYARGLGCATLLIAASASAVDAAVADVKILTDVGPEVIAGSTRMKAGTATKMVLNMISTAAMVSLGKTYGNLMVDLKPKSAKLRDRSIRILASLANLTEETARQRLEDSRWDLKNAVVREVCGIDEAQARDLLASTGGRVKAAIRTWRRPPEASPLPEAG